MLLLHCLRVCSVSINGKLWYARHDHAAAVERALRQVTDRNDTLLSDCSFPYNQEFDFTVANKNCCVI